MTLGDAGGALGVFATTRKGAPPPILVALLLVTATVEGVVGCPTSCTCNPSPTSATSFLGPGRGPWPSSRTGASLGAAEVPEVVAVNCRGAGFTRPPSNLSGLDPATVTEMDLSNNEITEVSGRAFALFSSLRSLKLSRNKIQKIASKAFQNLRIQILLLEDNRLSSLDEVSLPPLLREISLENNLFTAVPRSIATLRSLQSLNMAKNSLKALRDDDFQALHSIIILSLQQNRISTVDSLAFSKLRNLEILDLTGNVLTEVPSVAGHCPKLRQLLLGSNRLTYVGENALSGLVRLEEVSLQGNPLLNVHHQAFSKLPLLNKLILKEVKQLRDFPDLNGTRSLEVLRIDRAGLSSIPEDLCYIMPRLRSLNLQRNYITHIPDLNHCYHLRLIDLSNNNISSLRPAMFTGLSHLQDLLLQGNFITNIPDQTFLGLSQLQVLHLEDNRITTIDPEAFQPLVKLEDINLGKNSFPELPERGLEHVISIKVHNNRHLRVFPGPESFPMVRSLALSYAYHCCPFLSLEVKTEEEEPEIIEDVVFNVEGLQSLDPVLWNVSNVWPDIGINTNFAAIWHELAANTDLATTATNLDLDDIPTTGAALPQLPRYHVECIPEPGPFMPCEDLFDWWTLRCGVWIVFLLALLGNGTVVVVLLFARAKMDVPRFLVTNLAMADFFMGIYLGFLAVVDASTLGEFRMYAIPWQTSVGCQVAGFLGVLSCELSVYTLAVITMERNYAITHAMHLNKRLSLRHAVYIMLLGWVFAGTMAVLPLIGISDYRKFAVCLPIETAGAGLGYVVFLMFINGVAFLILMGCYLKIYCAIRGSQAWNSNDSRIAKRMALLVFTDFICWAPIAFFSLTAAFGLKLISLKEAKVFTVFILPFNSCCNPFLYALLTKQFKKDCVTLCKTIEESRVTRGIGRCRHSSNFSNRHTPANTNSALSSHQDNKSCHCDSKSQGPQKLHQRLKISAMKLFLCHKDVEDLNSTSDFSYQQHRSAVKSKRHTSVSSETYSSSWSDTWRRGPAAMSLRMLDRRNRNSWYICRKPSQESNLSSSRNDSSATTASTSTWRISRSSVSSDISSSGSRGVGKTDATAPSLRLGSLRERRIDGRVQVTARPVGPHQQALMVRQQITSPGQQPATTTIIARGKPRLQRQSAVERETYLPSKAVGQDTTPCPLHQRSDNLSCVYEQESYEDEETEIAKSFLNTQYSMGGLTVAFVPRKLSTISSHSISVAKDTDGDEDVRISNVDIHKGKDSSSSSTETFPRRGKCVSMTLLPQVTSQRVIPTRCPSDSHLPLSSVHQELLCFTNFKGKVLMTPSSNQDKEIFLDEAVAPASEPQYNKTLVSIPQQSLRNEEKNCSQQHHVFEESSALMGEVHDDDDDDEVFEEDKMHRKSLEKIETHFPLGDPPGETRPLI